MINFKINNQVMVTAYITDVLFTIDITGDEKYIKDWRFYIEKYHDIVDIINSRIKGGSRTCKEIEDRPFRNNLHWTQKQKLWDFYNILNNKVRK